MTQFLRAALIPIRHVHRLVIHMTGWLFTGWLLVLINQPAYAQPQVGYSSSQVGYSQVGYSQVGYSQVGYSPQVGYMDQRYDITNLLSTAGWLLLHN